MRISLPGLSILSILATAAGAERPPGPSSFTLDNGLTVVVIEDHRAPVVTQMVWYRVGSADDPAGRSGLAHFLEHLMFKATDELAEGAFSRIVAENGGSDNAFTTPDYTAFVSRVAADRLDVVMGMEADRMVDLAPTEASALSERDVVIEERRQVVDSDPGARFGEEVVAALYLNHPYGRPVIGWEHEIMGLDLPTAMAFYRAHYAPNNAVLVVAGDAEAEDVLRLAEKHFGPIPPSGAIEPRSRPQEPPHSAARRIDMRDPRVSEPVLSRSYLAPQRRTGDQREAAALVVLAELLGGAPRTSVMGQELLLGEGIAVGAEAYYSSIGLEARTFDLYVVPKQGVGLAEAEAELDRLIARFVEQGPDAAQLERIKGRVRAGEVYVLDDLVERASRVGAGLSSGLTLDDLEQWSEMLQAVTAEEVQAAARSLFVIENSVTGWLRPEPEGSSEPTR